MVCCQGVGSINAPCTGTHPPARPNRRAAFQPPRHAPTQELFDRLKVSPPQFESYEAACAAVEELEARAAAAAAAAGRGGGGLEAVEEEEEEGGSEGEGAGDDSGSDDDEGEGGGGSGSEEEEEGSDGDGGGGGSEEEEEEEVRPGPATACMPALPCTGRPPPPPFRHPTHSPRSACCSPPLARLSRKTPSLSGSLRS